MEKEIDFISGCPVKGCKRYADEIYWKHSGCGGHETLDVFGQLKCNKCSVEDHLMNWKFDCGVHDDGFQPGFYQGFLDALSVLAKVKGAEKFVKKLVKNWPEDDDDD